MLMPKRVKYRRVHRGRMTGRAYRGSKVTYGDFGLQALEPAWITSNQIEAARVAMTRYCKRVGKVWIKEYWVAVVKPDRVMFEIGGGVDEETAREAMRLAATKLPIKCKFVRKSDQEVEQ